jgi:diguanylate cyclase (GGDEF)-like protein/PAS domain S-box-containing protein
MNITTKTYQKIIDALHDGLYFVDRNRRITFWSKAAEHISGFSAADVIGKPCADNILTHVDSEGKSLCQQGCPIEATMRDGIARDAEVFMHHKDGHRLPVSIRTNTLTDENDVVIGAIELFTDLSAQVATKERLEELQKLALLDRLTHLANRHYITTELRKCFEEKQRFNLSFGLLFMDVDNFKHINDTHGHQVGDTMLKLIAKTLTSNGRAYDLVGRWGGEEFIGIIHNVSNSDLENQANRLRTLVECSYIMLDKRRLSATISVGATLAKADDTIKSLIYRADKAMYQSKAAGRNRVTIA